MTNTSVEKDNAVVEVVHDTIPVTTRAVPMVTAPTTTVPVGGVVAANPSMEPRTNCFAVASMVIGIISIVFAGLILGPLAILLGCVAMGQIKEHPQKYTGLRMAKAGIFCGVVGFVVYVIIIIAAVTA
jgi:Domain of unknown function (DUF4190)